MPDIGDHVRVVSLPALEGMPPETVAAFRYALGREFPIAGFGVYGHLELELGREADRLLGGIGNTIWIEPEHVVPVESEP